MAARRLTTWTRTATVAIAVVGLTAACGSGSPDTPAKKYSMTPKQHLQQAAGGKQNDTLTVGSKNFFAEQDVLGQITILVLREAGAKVVDKTDLGDTQEVRSSLLNGTIDLYWGYTGTAATIFLGLDKVPSDPQKLYEVVKREDLKQNGVAWLKPAPANNTYAIAIRPEVSKQGSADYDQELADVTTISDLARLAKQDPDKATICLGPEFQRRTDGLPGLEQHYGFEYPKQAVKVLPALSVYASVDTGQRCNFGVVFNDSGYIPAHHLRLLKDDKQFFPAYSPALTMRQATLKQYPNLKPLFAEISKKLDTPTLRKLNGKVMVEHQTPQRVARDWLQSEGLIS